MCVCGGGGQTVKQGGGSTVLMYWQGFRGSKPCVAVGARDCGDEQGPWRGGCRTLCPVEASTPVLLCNPQPLPETSAFHVLVAFCWEAQLAPLSH